MIRWNIKCTVCADDKNPDHVGDAVLRLGDGSNHNEPAAVAVAKAAGALAAFGKAVPSAIIDPQTFDLGWGGAGVPAAWFARHDGHKLVVISEYGELSDEYWPQEKA